MAALTQENYDKYDVRNDEWAAFTVKSGSTVYAGGLIGSDSATGEAVPWDDLSSTVAFIGVGTETVVGDGEKTCAVNTDGGIVQRIPIAGGPINVGDPVFCPTDNIADDANAAGNQAIGRVQRVYDDGAGTVVYDVALNDW